MLRNVSRKTNFVVNHTISEIKIHMRWMGAFVFFSSIRQSFTRYIFLNASFLNSFLYCKKKKKKQKPYFSSSNFFFLRFRLSSKVTVVDKRKEMMKWNNEKENILEICNLIFAVLFYLFIFFFSWSRGLCCWNISLTWLFLSFSLGSYSRGWNVMFCYGGSTVCEIFACKHLKRLNFMPKIQPHSIINF